MSTRKQRLANDRKELKDWYVRQLLFAQGWTRDGLESTEHVVELYRILIEIKRIVRGSAPV